MKVTVKGQVTIPVHIRTLMGIKPNMQVDFKVEDGSVFLVARDNRKRADRLDIVRGRLEGKITTEEVMKLTRGED